MDPLFFQTYVGELLDKDKIYHGDFIKRLGASVENYSFNRLRLSATKYPYKFQTNVLVVDSDEKNDNITYNELFFENHCQLWENIPNSIPVSVRLVNSSTFHVDREFKEVVVSSSTANLKIDHPNLTLRNVGKNSISFFAGKLSKLETLKLETREHFFPKVNITVDTVIVVDVDTYYGKNLNRLVKFLKDVKVKNVICDLKNESQRKTILNAVEK